MTVLTTPRLLRRILPALIVILTTFLTVSTAAAQDGPYTDGYWPAFLLNIQPRGVVINPGDEVQFTCTMFMDGEFVPVESPRWEAGGGEIDETGLFTAGDDAGPFWVACDAPPPEGSAGYHTAPRRSMHSSLDGVVMPPGQQPLSILIPPPMSPSTYGKPTRQDAAVYDIDYGGSADFYPEIEVAPSEFYAFTPVWTTWGGHMVDTYGGAYFATHVGRDQITAWTFDGSLSASLAIEVITPVPLVSLTASPDRLDLSQGDTGHLTAFAADEGGQTYPLIALWSADGGEIGGDGVYRATTIGEFTATASFESLSAAAAITVGAPRPDAIAITPDRAEINPGETVQFSAAGSTGGGEPYAIAPMWSAGGGEIDDTGLYTAGMMPGEYTVTAQMGGASAEAVVAIAAPPDDVPVEILIEPAESVLAPGQRQQFRATVRNASGETLDLPTAWSAEGGVVDESGRFTAGDAPGEASVTATVEGVTATAEIVIQEGGGGAVSGTPGWLPWVIGIGVLVVVGAAIAVFLLRSRARPADEG